MHTISKKDLNSADLRFCVQEGFVRRPHLLVGGVHSVTTNPRGSRRAAGAAGN